MKNFLVRLAQRSIGQVPVVRSRVMLAPPVIGIGDGAPVAEAPVSPAHPPVLSAGDTPSPVAAAVHTAGESPRAIPQPATAPSIAPPRAEIHAIHTARVITEVMERLVPAAPVEHDGHETQPPADLQYQPQIVPRPIQPAAAALAIQAAAPPIAVPDLAAQAPVPAPIATRGDAELAVDRSPAIKPASIEFIMPRREPPDTTEPIDHTVTMTPASRHQPTLPGLDSVPPVPPPAKVSPPSQERVVQVRIGAIEIHAPPPPPPMPAPIPRSVPRGGGFDEFARLRSYTPWEW
jgi:hypothetical protein